jgi:hypothetical protein
VKLGDCDCGEVVLVFPGRPDQFEAVVSDVQPYWFDGLVAVSNVNGTNPRCLPVEADVQTFGRNAVLREVVDE